MVRLEGEEVHFTDGANGYTYHAYSRPPGKPATVDETILASFAPIGGTFQFDVYGSTD